MRHLALLALLFAALGLAGCGGDDDAADDAGSAGTVTSAATDTAATTDTTAASGDLRTIEVQSAGFSLGVPDGWQGLSGDDFANSEALAQFQDENPSLAPYVEQLKGGNSPLKLLAASTDVEQGFATNVNTIVETVPDGTSVAEYGDRNVDGIKSSLDVEGDVETEEIDHEAGGAVVARYQARLNSGGKQQTFAFVQYYFVDGTTAYVVTYTTLPELLDEYEADFEASGNSFRLL